MEEKCLKVQHDKVFRDQNYTVNFDSCYSWNNYKIMKVQSADTTQKVEGSADLQKHLRQDLIHVIR
jgi:hypothetical protein